MSEKQERAARHAPLCLTSPEQEARVRELADRFDLLGSGRGLQRISIHAVYARTSAAAVTALLTERDELRERLAWVEKAAAEAAIRAARADTSTLEDTAEGAS